MSGGRRQHDGRRRRRIGLRPHEHEPSLRQVADQVLSGDAGHGAVSVMNAPIAVIPEGVGESIGDFGRVGRTE
jgi:hypothetical protein